MSIQTLRQLIRLLLTTQHSNRRISQLAEVSPNTVGAYREKLQASAFTVAELDDLADNQLFDRFHVVKPAAADKRLPDWAYTHQLMQHRHQTLIQLWEEYRLLCPSDAYCYSQFTHYYRQYVHTIDVSMRQYYRAGEVCFVDFAGKRIPWTDSDAGEEHQAEIFVGVLGHSQLVYARAVRSQKLECWLEAHIKMFDYYGGVTQLVVPDNLKSAVTTPASKVNKLAVINASYQELSEHYNFVIEPARIRRPQDKSLAEIGVLLVTRWITVVLRRRKFFSLTELNDAIGELLEQLNQRPFKRYEGNRRLRFNEQEKSSLSALPSSDFEIGHWIHQQKVNRDYHVYVHGHAYSVPYELVQQKVDIKACNVKVEIYFQHKLVALHIRSFIKGGATTENTHRPKSHQAYAEQSRSHFIQWANEFGEHASAIVLAQFSNKPEYSLKGCKASTQLQQLAKQYGQHRFERACECACKIQSLTVSSVRSILQCHLDESEVEHQTIQAALPLHQNVRGADYFVKGGSSNEY